MKIDINKDIILKSINIADGFVPAKSVNAILSNCLLKVSNNEIQIISTDNEISVKTTMDVVSDTDLSFTVNSRRMSSILKELPPGDVIIDVNDSYLIDIKTKSEEVKGSYRLIGASDDDYPELPEFDDNDIFEISENTLKQMIRKVIFAAAKDGITPVFNGVYFSITPPDLLTVVATDSRRLSIVKRNIKNKIDKEADVVVPLKTINEIYKLLSSDDVSDFVLDENQCFFRIGRSEITSRIVNGQFPKYEGVIPKEQGSFFSIKTNRLMDSLRRAMIFTTEPAYKIEMHISKEVLKIMAKTNDLGEAEEEIEIESNIDSDIFIGINAMFLLDSLREMDSETVKIGVTSDKSPVTIFPDNDPDYLSVIMPITLKSSD